MGATEVELGLRLEMYRAATAELPIDLIRLAEALGYHSVWTAEAYGCDALSPLAYIAALHRRASSSARQSSNSRPGRRRPWRCTR